VTTQIPCGQKFRSPEEEDKISNEERNQSIQTDPEMAMITELVEKYIKS
jgi:hypothetical protein